MIEDDLERRPVIVAIAGSNGAGKSTFYSAFLKQSGIRFINADVIAIEQDLDAYEAASVADTQRRECVGRSQSFIYETVLSDPHGAKIDFLVESIAAGFNVVFCFIAIKDATTSEQRVSMRVTQGGHDVPNEKLYARHPRTLANLRRAIERLPRVHIFDNGDLESPFQPVAEFHAGELTSDPDLLPAWLRDCLEFSE